ncbi:hypothetical protein DUI87_11481 [Hirundo rustica rustica]|uniref:Uncharacterized protein n=1 Tax=Hirundo rustica rustica TaxID=333673 RepID=A0A3M0KDZ9_HIRRU|nr:hypothetical protein DUI87_11481 [Hirundo rustica rustica]
MGTTRLRSDLMAPYNSPTGGMGFGLFYPATIHGTTGRRGNGLKRQRRRLRVDAGHNFLTERVVKYKNTLPKAVVESPSLEGLKTPVEVALEDTV